MKLNYETMLQIRAVLEEKCRCLLGMWPNTDKTFLKRKDETISISHIRPSSTTKDILQYRQVWLNFVPVDRWTSRHLSHHFGVFQFIQIDLPNTSLIVKIAGLRTDISVYSKKGSKNWWKNQGYCRTQNCLNKRKEIWLQQEEPDIYIESRISHIC